MTSSPPAHVERWQQGLIGGLASLLLVLVSLLAAQAYRNVVRPPPLAFTAEVYAPIRGDICPGGVVSYRSRLIVTRVPALVVVARTLWGVGEQRTLVPDTQPKFFVWNEAEKGQSVSRVVDYHLPRDLPAGFYEVRGAASSLNSDAAAYRVPFVIAESCFKKGAK